MSSKEQSKILNVSYRTVPTVPDFIGDIQVYHRYALMPVKSVSMQSILCKDSLLITE